MLFPTLMLIAACTTTLRISTDPSGADIYITDYPPMQNTPPQSYVAHGQAPFNVDIDYWAWEKYYVWAGLDGYKSQVYYIRNELKLGPALGGLCFWPLWAWALGPDDAPIYIKLEPEDG